MTLEPKILLRLQFMVRVVRKECMHLATTDQRLFGAGFTLEQAAKLEENIELAVPVTTGNTMLAEIERRGWA